MIVTSQGHRTDPARKLIKDTGMKHPPRYTHIHTHSTDIYQPELCVDDYMYIYIYIYIEREREKKARKEYKRIVLRPRDRQSPTWDFGGISQKRGKEWSEREREREREREYYEGVYVYIYRYMIRKRVREKSDLGFWTDRSTRLLMVSAIYLHTQSYNIEESILVHFY